MAEFAPKYEALILKRERSRLHVTLNRPEVKNALNPTLIGELRQVFDILRDRRDIKVVVLRGAGYLWESPTARAFRDSRLASIGGGADEVMLQIISKAMGTLPRSNHG